MKDYAVLDWIKLILLFIWQLPQNIVGLVMMPFIGKKTLIAEGHYNFCWHATGMNGGISLGLFCYVSNLTYSSNKKLEKISHEFNGHTVDSKLWGPLYLFVVGIPSILNAIFDITENYYDFYTEKWANKHAGLNCNEQYPILLEFIDEESKQNIEKYMKN